MQELKMLLQGPFYIIDTFYVKLVFISNLVYSIVVNYPPISIRFEVGASMK